MTLKDKWDDKMTALCTLASRLWGRWELWYHDEGEGAGAVFSGVCGGDGG